VIQRDYEHMLPTSEANKPKVDKLNPFANMPSKQAAAPTEEKAKNGAAEKQGGSTAAGKAVKEAAKSD